MPWTHALDLAKAHVKDGNNDLAVTRVHQYVAADTLAMIKVGDDVIRRVRELLPLGAGNQKFDHKAAQGQIQKPGSQTYLAHKAYEGHYPHAQHVAGAAMKHGAGNCQEQAAVAYLLLRERLDGSRNVAFCYSDAYKHCFAAIGNPTSGKAEEVVIVDSWPKYTQALRWIDHFCYPHVGVYACKPGVGGEGKIARAKSKYENAKISMEALMALYNHFPYSYNHKWACRNKTVMVYTNDLLIF
jgi:hypothetical protein